MPKLHTAVRGNIIQSAALAATIPMLCSQNVAHASSEYNDSIRCNYFDDHDGQIHYWTAGKEPNLVLVHQSNKDGIFEAYYWVE